MPKVAIIYDTIVRPDTTGVYCKRALESLVDVHYFSPHCLEAIPRTGFDLYLRIDDGLPFSFPRDLKPSACWVIDTHMDLEGALIQASMFDWVFAAQRDGAHELRRAGHNAEWLPLACDPEIHHPWPLENRWDVCFVGNGGHGPRKELLDLLQSQFPRTFIGQRYFDDYAKAYSASYIGFNRSVKNDLNMRVFETLACGPLLITNDLSENGQAELFRDETHLVTYREPEELCEKVRFYLKHQKVRRSIAEKGRCEATQNHTYRHRMSRILETTLKRMRATAYRDRLVAAKKENAGSSSMSINRTPNSTRKSAAYFQCSRPEVIALIPPDAKRVLDVGCGGGYLGELLKRRQAVEVVGLELHPAAIAMARVRLDQVHEGSLEDPNVEFSSSSFDCVVCADVLEHLRDPADVLSKIRRWLTPDGTVVCSIPNVRHHSVIEGLMEGNWTYESAGLLDADHVRFFTRREIEKLFYRTRFQIEKIQVIPGLGHSEWVSAGRPRTIRVGGLSIDSPSSEHAEEFFVYQYLIVARRRGRMTAAGSDSTRRAGIERLYASSAWPESKPSVSAPVAHLGWCNESAQKLLREELKSSDRVIVELGAWLGLSTRLIAELAPGADIITIDTWAGSPEHRARPEWASMLPALFETFVAMNWEYRERITPLRANTLEGLQLIASVGLQADVVYIDAEHSYEAVRSELEMCHRLFPNARLIGDDYHDANVRRAVDDFATRAGRRVEPVGTGLPAWRLSSPPSESVCADAWGLTSIIIVAHNQLPFTKECIDSILLRTDEAYELILVDNGSTDGTLEYFKTIEGAKIIVNASNRGFPAAVNQGVAVAEGRQVLLLNNDTIASTGWLRRMLGAMFSDSSIGLVGPCSNNVIGEQLIRVQYQDVSMMDGFAWDWGKHHAGQRVETRRLVGFCLLIRREVIDQIGVMDERFGIGCFEDDDYCLRASRAGWKAVVARDAFVHHYGGRTFASIGHHYSMILKNRLIFQEKWKSLNFTFSTGEVLGASRSEGKRPEPAYRQASGGGLLLGGTQ